eukprot:gnl/MRDRNA2_/MRDRNA2_177560_c0_seq1.p1 gnl/MRDRNA2_/MRDRNA2_177560_c0~~gnl/MRDRNA2_/MRDRNA2_177560_c0_seq1.p1  ORF type:complete len:217 (-),score=31.92 gnl/MRDRNA2_/MRDRNA2_177560_c0_seq1:144-794(-)
MVFGTGWWSSCAWRVRLCLYFKKIPFVAKSASQHKVQNAMKQVPFLSSEPWSGPPLAQTVAICEFLEDLVPEPSVFPLCPRARARVRQMVEIVNSFLHPRQTEGTAFLQTSAPRGLDALEALANHCAGNFLGGDTPGLADFFVVPQLGNIRAAGATPMLLSRYPRLLSCEAQLKNHPVYAAAHPAKVVLEASGIPNEVPYRDQPSAEDVASRWPSM